MHPLGMIDDLNGRMIMLISQVVWLQIVLSGIKKKKAMITNV